MAAGHFTGAKGKKNLSVAADQDNEKNLYLPSRSGVLSTETRNIFSEPDARRVLVYKRNLVQMMYSSFFMKFIYIFVNKVEYCKT